MATKEKRLSMLRPWWCSVLFFLAALSASAHVPRLAETRVWPVPDFAPPSVRAELDFDAQPQGFYRPLCYELALNPSIDPDGRIVIQQWQATQQRMLIEGGFWNNAGAYGISFGITAQNAFSLGSFGRNDTLVDRNLAGEITDAQLYGGMAINSGAAAAAVVTGGAVAPIAGRALVATGSPALMYVGSGAAAGATTAATDVAIRRTGYAANDIQYDGTVGGDLAYIGGATVLGGAAGGVTYAAVRSGQGVVYLRTDANGNVGNYYGQANSPARFDARMVEHQAANPNAQFSFTQVNSARSGNALDFMEQFYITANGGARTQNPATELSNAYRAMSDARFMDFLFGTTAYSGGVGAGGASTVLGKK